VSQKLLTLNFLKINAIRLWQKELLNYLYFIERRHSGITNERAPGVEFCIWYLRIRSTERTVGLFDRCSLKQDSVSTDNDGQKRPTVLSVDLIRRYQIQNSTPGALSFVYLNACVPMK